MTPEIAKIVGLKTQPKPLLDFTQKLKDLVAMSRSEMSKSYDQWDRYDMIYRGERVADTQDKKADVRGEPVKMILPLTFGQVQTFVAFGHQLYNQRDYFYETIASGQEDEGAAKIASALLEQNLTYNKYRAVKLIQKLTDIARWGLGITKCSWVKETVPVVSQVVDQEKMAAVRPDMAAPVEPPMKNEVTYSTKYLGNKIVNISPYRWFPDARLPISRWADGEFCADEIEESKVSLQRNPLVAGMEHVAEMGPESFKDRRMSFLKRQSDPSNMGATLPAQYCLLTEIQIRLNPSKTEIDKDVFLADHDCEQVYLVWMVNDDRIVRISEAGYNHEEFSYDCAQLFDDQNRFVNFSLCETLSALQDTATWFLNSHITNVRKNIFNQMIVDESAVNVDDIIARRPVIRMKAGRAGSGVDTWIKQLNTVDITAGHVDNIGILNGMAKEATGINETLLGQFSPGRRSAKEAGNVANYAASRLVMLFGSIWESSEASQARKMLSNLRQGLDEPTLVRMYGQINTQQEVQGALSLVPGLTPQQPGQQQQLRQVTKDNLVGNYDLTVFNGTLPSQRQSTANVLLQWLETALKDPRIVQVTGLDPQLVLFEVFELLGVRNVQRFRLTPERLQQLMLMAQPAANAGGPPTA
jgi:hypothetical protein